MAVDLPIKPSGHRLHWRRSGKKLERMTTTKTKQIFETVTWLMDGLAVWAFGAIAWMTVVAPRLPDIITFTVRTIRPISSPVLFIINALPQAIFGFICGAVLSVLTGYRKFLIFAAVAAPNLLTFLQLVDNYQYEFLTYRGVIPNSIMSGMVERQMTVLVVLPTALWVGAALVDRCKRNRETQKTSHS
jgi:hypothetical protein